MSEIGHNRSLADRMRDDTETVLAALLERRDALVAAANKAFVTDADSTGRAGDLLKLIRALRERAEMEVGEVRLPVDQARGAIVAAEDRFLDPLDSARVRVEGLIETFRNEERARIAAQREAQRSAEAQARAAAAARRAAAAPDPGVQAIDEPGLAAPAADAPVMLPKVRGDYGSLTRDTARATFTIDDVRALPDEVLHAPAVTKALMSAIRTYHRLNPSIPGVTVGGAVKSQVRS